MSISSCFRTFAVAILIIPYPGLTYAQDPTDAKGFLERGIAYTAKKDYDSAIADYTQAIRLAPKLAEAYGRRAHARQVKGEDDLAIADSNSALALDPKLYIAFYSRGYAFNHKGEYDKAISDLTKAVELNPKSNRTFYGRGNAFAGKGDYENAIKDYTESIRLDSKFGAAYRKRANAFMKVGDEARSKADLQEARRLEKEGQQAEAQVENAGQLSEKKLSVPTTPAVDLAKAMELAGFQDVHRLIRGGNAPIARDALSLQIEQFLRFGSSKKAQKAMLGHPLERVDVENKAEAHRRRVASHVWSLNDHPIIVPKDNNEKYVRDGKLLVVCSVTFRIAILPNEGKDAFSPTLSQIHASWASSANMWFLTKEGKLSECRDGQDVLAVEKANGILYLPEGKTTDLALILRVDKEVAKKLVQKPADFKVDLVFDQLEYSSALNWGFYRRDKLVDADWNSQSLIDWNSTGAFGDLKDPHYFRPEGIRKPSLVSANLLSAALRDKDGKEHAAYKRGTQSARLVIVPQSSDAPVQRTDGQPKQK